MFEWVARHPNLAAIIAVILWMLFLIAEGVVDTGGIQHFISLIYIGYE